MMDSMKKLFISQLVKISVIFISFVTAPNFYTQTLSAEKIYKQVSDAVVVILAYDSNDELSMQGSGVVINDKGYVVTNYHVLAGNDRLEVFHNKELIPYVDIIGIDVEKDILILKIEEKKFPAIKIGNSEKLSIGQRVYAIGSPLGFENTISEGIISGLRSYDVTGKNFIQITASISPGSSGGAVVNDKGELIGISTLTAKEGQNLNFAIPINDVLSVKISSYSQDEAYKEFEWFLKGIDEAEKGNYKEAVKCFTTYIRQYPNDAAAYYNRGLSMSYLEDYKSSLQDYDKAIALRMNYFGAYHNRGLVKNGLGDYKGAIQDYNKAIEMNPNYEVIFANRGDAKACLEDYKGAIEDYNKAIEINPNYAGAYNNRGVTKTDLEDYRGAILDYNKAIEINPNDALAYLNRGIARKNLESYRGAIQDYNKSIELNPNDEVTFYRRGGLKFLLEDYTGAIQDYSIAIEINPNYAMAYYNRGVAKFTLEDISGACLDWSKAGELGFDSAYTLIRKYCK